MESWGSANEVGESNEDEVATIVAQKNRRPLPESESRGDLVDGEVR